MPSKGTELDVVDVSKVQAALMDGGELPTIENPDDVARAIMERILGAETVDEVFGMFEATSGKDVLGVPLEAHGVRWQRSAFEQGAPVFAAIDATRGDTGERVTITTSGRSVLAALLAFQRMGAYPVRFMLDEAKNPTPEGYRPLRLARV